MDDVNDEPSAAGSNTIKTPGLVVHTRITRGMAASGSGIPKPSGIKPPEAPRLIPKRKAETIHPDEDTDPVPDNRENVRRRVTAKRRKTIAPSPEKAAAVPPPPPKQAVRRRSRRLPAVSKPLRQTLPANSNVVQKSGPRKAAPFPKPNELPKPNVVGAPRRLTTVATSKGPVAGKTTAAAVSKPAAAAAPPTQQGGTNKRLPWDTRGKIQDSREKMDKLQQENKALKQHNVELQEQFLTLEKENLSLTSRLQTKDEQLIKTTGNLANLKKELPELRSKIISLEEVVASQHNENNGLQETINSLETRLATLEREKTDLSALVSEKESLSASLTLELEKAREEIEKLSHSLRENETLRRKQHNLILELKGNIRVFCRVRPLLKRTDATTIEFKSCKTMMVSKPPDSNASAASSSSTSKLCRSNAATVEFTLDHVFEPSCGQETVFEEVAQLVQSVLDGFNVCIFAYGQTGSGKTYTMEGPPALKDFDAECRNPELGVIPRSVQQIFKVAREMALHGWKFEIQLSFVEIYNETLKDLIQMTPSNESSTVGNQSQRQGLWLGEKDGNTILSNITVYTVTSETDVYRLMKVARKHRNTAATMNNQHSSRSHSVFVLRVKGMNEKTGESSDGTLNLVDLAGSEKLGEGNLIAERNKLETININKSLSNLGNVIMALSKKTEHVPYRNSKLTHLLKNSLGGNSKTLMIVNVSPDAENVNETINSLRFATKVNQCKIGTATKVKA